LAATDARGDVLFANRSLASKLPFPPPALAAAQAFADLAR